MFFVGELLNEVINLLGNDVLGVKFSIFLDVIDVYVIDIKYYKNCWFKNVINVIKKVLVFDKCSLDLVIEVVVRIEFLLW